MVKLPSFRSYALRVEEIREQVIDTDLIFWFQGDLGTVQLLFTLFGTKSDRQRFFCSSLVELDLALQSCNTPVVLVLSSSIGLGAIDAALMCVSAAAVSCSTLLILKTASSCLLKSLGSADIHGMIVENSIIFQTRALLECFKSINRGERFSDPALFLFNEKEGYSSALSELTDRQFQVLLALCDGATNEEIALRLGFSVFTARDHVNQIIHKFGVANRTAAVVYAIRNGIV